MDHFNMSKKKLVVIKNVVIYDEREFNLTDGGVDQKLPVVEDIGTPSSSKTSSKPIQNLER